MARTSYIQRHQSDDQDYLKLVDNITEILLKVALNTKTPQNY